MKSIKSVILLTLSPLYLLAKGNDKGDIIVLAADTSIVVMNDLGTNILGTELQGDAKLFTYDGVTYRLETFTPYSEQLSNGKYDAGITIIGQEINNGSRGFGANISASVLPQGANNVQLNNCPLTYVASGLKVSACMTLKRQGCNREAHSVSSRDCEIYTSEDKESIAYALEQHILTNIISLQVD